MYKIDQLTIIIPTFNRPEGLLKQVKKLLEIDCDYIYEVIILDNNSSASLDMVLQLINGNNKFRIRKNNFNIGLASNIVQPFLLCKTKWLWILSDDDEIYNNPIKNIEKVTNQNKDTSFIKFSNNQNKIYENDENLSSIDEFVNYFNHKNRNSRKGNFVFLSTSIFNMQQLHKYLPKSFEFSYSNIGHIIPVIFALDEGKSIIFSSIPISKFIEPGQNKWSYTKIGMGMTILSHMDLNISENLKRELMKVLFFFKPMIVIRYILRYPEKNSIEGLREIKHFYLRYFSIKDKIYTYLFLMMYPLIRYAYRIIKNN